MVNIVFVLLVSAALPHPRRPGVRLGRATGERSSEINRWPQGFRVAFARVAVAIGAFALTLPKDRRPIFTISVIVLAGLFTVTMPAIVDLETPFNGVIRVSNYQLADAEDDMTREFTADYGAAAVPCDDRGLAR